VDLVNHPQKVVNKALVHKADLAVVLFNSQIHVYKRL